MPKFKLIAEHVDLYGNSNGHKLTYEFEVDHISGVLENVDYFIRGVGYHPEGTLNYVTDDDYYGYSESVGPQWQEETPQDDIGHSEFYFDIERNK
jgi:hypothetical protein